MLRTLYVVTQTGLRIVVTQTDKAPSGKAGPAKPTGAKDTLLVMIALPTRTLLPSETLLDELHTIISTAYGTFAAECEPRRVSNS